MMKPIYTKITTAMAAALLLSALPVISTLTAPAAAQQRSQKPKRYRSSVLVVVTNFDKATVTVNGRAYPSYVEPGEPEGMILPAGGPYQVEVKYDGKAKLYTLTMRPNETRYLVVDLSGFKGSATSSLTPPVPNAPTPVAEEEQKEEDGEGKVTAYSKPRGNIFVDGKDTGKMAPNTVPMEPGRHEIQVRYENGEMSEKKIVRVRKGSSIKLFFRQKTP